MKEFILYGFLGLVISCPIVIYVIARFFSLQVAHAWDLQTHDKMTCYSLKLLCEQKHPTLLGWVLQEIDSIPDPEMKRTFQKHLVWELRRGSIEEDMNSNMINVLDISNSINKICRHLGAKSGGLAATKLLKYFVAAANPITFKVSLITALVVSGYYAGQSVAKRAYDKLAEIEMLEGANGLYHFYNPAADIKANPTKGLSEVYWFHFWVNQISKQRKKPPMPMYSAKDRVFQYKGEFKWFFDYEERNYSLTDAALFYRDGIHNLAFYSMGRVLHLLQDMTVPAHTRDDSHMGIYSGSLLIEPSDPLEKYAAYKDWEGEGFNPDPVMATNSVKWSFYPSRKFMVDERLFIDEASSLWRDFENIHSVRNFGTLYDELAAWTSSWHYSLGTIPGNANSHDPNNTSLSPCPGKPDWNRCDPNDELLMEIFDKRINQPLMRIFENNALYSHIIKVSGADFQEAVNRYGEMTNNLNSENQINRYRLTKKANGQILREYLGIIKNIYTIMEKHKPSILPSLAQAQKSGRSFYIDDQPNLWALEYTKMKKVLDELYKTASEHEQDIVKEVLRRIIDNAYIMRWEDDLRAFYRNYEIKDKSKVTLHFLNPWYPEGPCHLGAQQDERERITGGDIIENQYRSVYPRAIYYGARFLSNWFERPFKYKQLTGMSIWKGPYIGGITWQQDYEKMPIDIWFGPTRGDNTHLVEEIITAEQKDRVIPYKSFPKPYLPLGFNHRMPAPLDFLIEIEIGFDNIEDEEGFKDITLKVNSNIASLIGEETEKIDGVDHLSFTKEDRCGSWSIKRVLPYNYNILNRVFKIPGESKPEAETPIHANPPEGAKKIEPRGGIRVEAYDTIRNDIRLDQHPPKIDQEKNSIKYTSYIISLEFELELPSESN